jgi:hypothetical protein
MGKTPDSGRVVTWPTFWAMKTNCRKKPLTFGEFVAAAHDAWGERRAGGFVWLAVNAHMVEFRGPQRFVFSKRNLNYLPF